MKRIILFLIILIPFYFLVSQDLNYAKRLLKLANTNIWLEKYSEASNLVEEAKKIISKYNSWEAKYWDAVADETLGHIYFQLGNYDLAENKFTQAHSKYTSLIRTNYEGSQYASKELKEKSRDKNGLISQKDNRSKKEIAYHSYSVFSGNQNLSNDVYAFVAIKSNINNFPTELFGKKNLKYIILKNNRIDVATIRDLPSLEFLDLSNNFLTNFQLDVASVPNLRYLDLSNNRLSTIPKEILSLRNLEFIDVSNNMIPFSEIVNLIQNLKNTIVIFDKYDRKK